MLATAAKSSYENVGEFCCYLLLLFFYSALSYIDIFGFQAYAIKCVKIKANFWVLQD